MNFKNIFYNILTVYVFLLHTSAISANDYKSDRALGFKLVSKKKLSSEYNYEVFQYEYSNGLKLFVMPNLRKSSKINMTIYVDAASNREDINSFEYAHLIEHMIYSNKKTEELTSNFVNFNAKTYHNRVFYDYEFVSFKLDEVLSKSKEAMFIVPNDLNLFEAEKSSVIQEVSTKFVNNSSTSICYDKIDKSNPSYKMTGLEFYFKPNIEYIKEIKLQNLISFHSKYYHSKNISVIINGNVSPDEIAKKISKIYFDIPNSNVIPFINLYEIFSSQNNYYYDKIFICKSNEISENEYNFSFDFEKINEKDILYFYLLGALLVDLDYGYNLNFVDEGVNNYSSYIFSYRDSNKKYNPSSFSKYFLDDLNNISNVSESRMTKYLNKKIQEINYYELNKISYINEYIYYSYINHKGDYYMNLQNIFENFSKNDFIKWVTDKFINNKKNSYFADVYSDVNDNNFYMEKR